VVVVVGFVVWLFGECVYGIVGGDVIVGYYDCVGEDVGEGFGFVCDYDYGDVVCGERVDGVGECLLVCAVDVCSGFVYD